MQHLKGFPCGSVGKESACHVGDLGSIPGLGRFPGEGKVYPLQYSGLENSMDCTGGAWWAAVYGVAQSRTRHPEVRGERREPLADKTWESTLLSRSGGVKGLTGSGAVNCGVGEDS